MTDDWQTHIEGSDCGRYIYTVIVDGDGKEIDRYISEDRMETIYGWE